MSSGVPAGRFPFDPHLYEGDFPWAAPKGEQAMYGWFCPRGAEKTVGGFVEHPVFWIARKVDGSVDVCATHIEGALYRGTLSGKADITEAPFMRFGDDGVIRVRAISGEENAVGGWECTEGAYAYRPNLQLSVRFDPGTHLPDGSLSSYEQFVAWVFMYVGRGVLNGLTHAERARFAHFGFAYEPTYSLYVEGLGGNVRVKSEDPSMPDHPALRFREARESAMAIFMHRTRTPELRAQELGQEVPLTLRIFTGINTQCQTPVAPDEFEESLEELKDGYQRRIHEAGPMRLCEHGDADETVHVLKRAARGDLVACSKVVEWHAAHVMSPYRIEFAYRFDHKTRSADAWVFLPDDGIVPLRSFSDDCDDLPSQRISDALARCADEQTSAAEMLVVADCLFRTAPWVRCVSLTGVQRTAHGKRLLWSGAVGREAFCAAPFAEEGRAFDVACSLGLSYDGGIAMPLVFDDRNIRFCGFSQLGDDGWPVLRRVRLANLYQQLPVGFPVSDADWPLLFEQRPPSPDVLFMADDVDAMISEAEGIMENLEDFDIDALERELAGDFELEAPSEGAYTPAETSEAGLLFPDFSLGAWHHEARPVDPARSSEWKHESRKVFELWRRGRDQDALEVAEELTAAYEGDGCPFVDTAQREYRSFGSLIERGLYTIGRDSDRELALLSEEVAPIFSFKGYILALLGRSGEAQEALRTALRYNPVHAPSYVHLSQLYWHLHDYQLSFAAAKRAHAFAYRASELTMAYRTFGDYAAVHGDIELAAVLYQKAISYAQTPDELRILDGELKRAEEVCGRRLRMQGEALDRRLRRNGLPTGPNARVRAVARAVVQDCFILGNTMQCQIAQSALEL